MLDTLPPHPSKCTKGPGTFLHFQASFQKLGQRRVPEFLQETDPTPVSITSFSPDPLLQDIEKLGQKAELAVRPQRMCHVTGGVDALAYSTHSHTPHPHTQHIAHNRHTHTHVDLSGTDETDSRLDQTSHHHEGEMKNFVPTCARHQEWHK